MSEAQVRALLAEGVVVPVEADPVAAATELATARRHLDSANELSTSDPVAAFAVGYEAVRKAISAHMRAHGVRASPGGGQHVRTGRYAMAALDDRVARGHLLAFDELRLLRNQSQYEGLAIESREVEDLLVHARAIVSAVGEDLAS